MMLTLWQQQCMKMQRQVNPPNYATFFCLLHKVLYNSLGAFMALFMRQLGELTVNGMGDRGWMTGRLDSDPGPLLRKQRPLNMWCALYPLSDQGAHIVVFFLMLFPRPYCWNTYHAQQKYSHHHWRRKQVFRIRSSRRGDFVDPALPVMPISLFKFRFQMLSGPKLVECPNS